MAEIWTPGREGHPLWPPGFVPKRRIIGSPNYVLNHPTRYGWNKHVVPIVRKLYRVLGTGLIHVVTYVEHPPEEQLAVPRRLDRLSLDVWHGDGRGVPVDPDVGWRAYNIMWHDRGRPYIDWIIWQAQIRQRAHGFAWEPFGTDPISWHYDHVHVTFHERSFRL